MLNGEFMKNIDDLTRICDAQSRALKVTSEALATIMTDGGRSLNAALIAKEALETARPDFQTIIAIHKAGQT